MDEREEKISEKLANAEQQEKDTKKELEKQTKIREKLEREWDNDFARIKKELQFKREEMMKEAGKKPIGTKPYGQPRDKLDKACMKHDKAYNEEDRTLESVRKADEELISEADKIRKQSKSLKERLASMAVNKLMGAKVKLEDKGIMKKGSFASVPNKKVGEAYRGGYMRRVGMI